MKIKIKSEAFLRNYIESNGGEVTYDLSGRMNDVYDEAMGDSVNYMMVKYMGKTLEGTRNDTCYSSEHWDWPLWLCEEVEE